MTLTELLSQHIERWDSDCQDHYGCTCGALDYATLRDADDGARGSSHGHEEDMPSRVLWRAHLAEVIEASHSVTKEPDPPLVACRFPEGQHPHSPHYHVCRRADEEEFGGSFHRNPDLHYRQAFASPRYIESSTP